MKNSKKNVLKCPHSISHPIRTSSWAHHGANSAALSSGHMQNKFRSFFHSGGGGTCVWIDFMELCKLHQITSLVAPLLSSHPPTCPFLSYPLPQIVTNSFLLPRMRAPAGILSAAGCLSWPHHCLSLFICPRPHQCHCLHLIIVFAIVVSVLNVGIVLSPLLCCVASSNHVVPSRRQMHLWLVCMVPLHCIAMVCVLIVAFPLYCPCSLSLVDAFLSHHVMPYSSHATSFCCHVALSHCPASCWLLCPLVLHCIASSLSLMSSHCIVVQHLIDCCVRHHGHHHRHHPLCCGHRRHCHPLHPGHWHCRSWRRSHHSSNIQKISLS